MSEVDRLSNSGTYPALPISAQRRAKEDSRPPFGQQPSESGENDEKPQSSAVSPRPIKSIIDEFA